MSQLPFTSDAAVSEISLPVAHIESRAGIGRTEYEPRCIAEMAESMTLVGQLQRIAVRPIRANRYEVIYGELRLQAAILLGWETLDVRVIRADDRTLLTLYAHENLHRAEINLALHVDVVMQLHESGLTEAAIAKILARPLEWVADALAVAREPIARAMARTGLLSTARAWREFMQLPATSRRRLLESGEPITVAGCEREEKRIKANEARSQTLKRRVVEKKQ
jgi:ParB/RepB/Spo0J family partition protein